MNDASRNAEAGADPAADAREPAIALDGLTVQLGDHRALEDVSLRIADGAFVAIVGPNGAGKSTLLKVLLGLRVPTAGAARVCGRPPADVPAGWTGYVPQIKTMDRSFPAVAIDLVVTGLTHRWPARIRPADRERAMAALERVGAAHLARRGVGLLSGGELQRVYLARSIVRQPRVILLDEPATGMDVRGEGDMHALLEEVQEATRATILMVTQDWGAAYHHATDVLVLNRHVIAYGPPEEAFGEDFMRHAFGHVGHHHAMAMAGIPHAAHQHAAHQHAAHQHAAHEHGDHAHGHDHSHDDEGAHA